MQYRSPLSLFSVNADSLHFLAALPPAAACRGAERNIASILSKENSADMIMLCHMEQHGLVFALSCAYPACLPLTQGFAVW
jgi:hypothetical protein